MAAPPGHTSRNEGHGRGSAISTEGIVLDSQATYTLRRVGRFLVAELTGPHRVLSTSFVNGGAREDIRYLVNHQICEPAGHEARGDQIVSSGMPAYHEAVCSEMGIAPERAVVIGTAANMQYAAMAAEALGDLHIVAVATAAVRSNAARAGDPTRWDEHDAEWEERPVDPGTINTLLLLDHPLSVSAMAHAVVTITEAKCAVLGELAVPSLASQGLATGTTTDQYAIASPIDATMPLRTASGTQCWLGERIARAVMSAIREALRWQDGLEPSTTRSLFHALSRFGLTEERLRAELQEDLAEPAYALFVRNWEAIVFEPQVAACAYAIAAVLDRIAYGSLPPSAAREIVVHQCALLAAQLAAKPGAASRLLPLLDRGETDAISTVISALAAGWAEKWVPSAPADYAPPTNSASSSIKGKI